MNGDLQRFFSNTAGKDILQSDIKKNLLRENLKSYQIIKGLQQLKILSLEFTSYASLFTQLALLLFECFWILFEKIKIIKLFQTIKAVGSQHEMLHLCLTPIFAAKFILMTKCPGNTWYRVWEGDLYFSWLLYNTDLQRKI